MTTAENLLERLVAGLRGHFDPAYLDRALFRLRPALLTMLKEALHTKLLRVASGVAEDLRVPGSLLSRARTFSRELPTVLSGEAARFVWLVFWRLRPLPGTIFDTLVTLQDAEMPHGSTGLGEYRQTAENLPLYYWLAYSAPAAAALADNQAEDLHKRRTLPQLRAQLRQHPQGAGESVWQYEKRTRALTRAIGLHEGTYRLYRDRVAPLKGSREVLAAFEAALAFRDELQHYRAADVLRLLGDTADALRLREPPPPAPPLVAKLRAEAQKMRQMGMPSSAATERAARIETPAGRHLAERLALVPADIVATIAEAEQLPEVRGVHESILRSAAEQAYAGHTEDLDKYLPQIRQHSAARKAERDAADRETEKTARRLDESRVAGLAGKTHKQLERALTLAEERAQTADGAGRFADARRATEDARIIRLALSRRLR